MPSKQHARKGEVTPRFSGVEEAFLAPIINMVTPVHTPGEQVTVIIEPVARYKPLGVMIRKRSYSVPHNLPSVGHLREYLAKIRQDLHKEVSKTELQEIADHFYKDLGLFTSNLEGFLSLNAYLRAEFRETFALIADRLWTSFGGGGDLSQPNSLAQDFLKPLVFISIPEDPDHVWGYLTPGTSPQAPEKYPDRCKWGSMEPNTATRLNELYLDLVESFERRNDPQPFHPSQNQCHAPQHQVRLRTWLEIAGPEEVGEGEAVELISENFARLEFGNDYESIEELGGEEEWRLSAYTCPEKPVLDILEEKKVILKAPAIFNDCTATVQKILRPPLGPVRSVSMTINIFNTINTSPEVTIRGPREAMEGEKVTLLAVASDADKDGLTYIWKQTRGLPVDGIAKEKLFSFTAGAGEYVFTVTVQDKPIGARAVPSQTSATHALIVKQRPVEKRGVAVGQVKISAPVKLKTRFSIPQEILMKSSKYDQLGQLAEETGGTPKGVSSEYLVEAVIESLTPEEALEGMDIILLIDTSESMDDDVEQIQKETGRILREMSGRWADLSKVRLGIYSYVDDEWKEHAPLGKLVTGKKGFFDFSSAMDKKKIEETLEEVIAKIRDEGGGRETVWDALWLTLTKAGWREEEEIRRKIVYITDEDGDDGRLGKTVEVVAETSKRKGVRLDPIFLSDSELILDPKLTAAMEHLERVYQEIMKMEGSDEKRHAILNIYISWLKRASEYARGWGICVLLRLASTHWKGFSHSMGLAFVPSHGRDEYLPWIMEVSDEKIRLELAENLPLLLPYHNLTYSIGVIKDIILSFRDESLRIKAFETLFLKNLWFPLLRKEAPASLLIRFGVEASNFLPICFGEIVATFTDPEKVKHYMGLLENPPEDTAKNF